MDILNAIKTLLQRSPALADQIAWDGWAAQQREMAEKVTRAGRDGDCALRRGAPTRSRSLSNISGKNPATGHHWKNQSKPTTTPWMRCAIW